jgi:hypothetical protein
MRVCGVTVMSRRIAIAKGLASNRFGDRLLAKIHNRKGNAKKALTLLTGDLSKRDFADMNANRPLRLKYALAWYGVLVEPDRRRADARDDIIVARVHDVSPSNSFTDWQASRCLIQAL